MKKCKLCGELKYLEEYHKDKQAKDWRRGACIECWRKQTNCRYQLNKIHWVKRKCRMVEVKAPAPRVNVWEWIKRLFYK